MKKLTAGIFATILGVTAMGTADAAVTSKGYVDAAVGTVAQSVTDLGTTVSNTYATKDALTSETNARTSADNTLQGNINTLAGTVGILPEGQSTVVGYIESKTANIATDATVQALAGRVTTAEGEIDVLQEKTEGLGSAAYTESTAYATAAQGATADATAATVATYGDIVTHNVAEFATAAQGATADSTAATVATYGDIVTHDAAEFATAAQGAKADTAVQPAAIEGMATQTWVEGKGYLTEHQSLAEYAKTADVVTNSEFTAFQSTNTAAIADAKQAGTEAAAAAATADGKAVAAQGTADEALGKANTNAVAITNLQEFDNSIKTATENAVDGTYTLTMKKNAETGAMEFGWELIERDGTLN